MIVPGVIYLTSKTIYGFTSRNVPMYLFQPFDTTLPAMIVGCSEKDRTKNRIGLATPIDESVQRIPHGVLIRVLGVCGDNTAEEEAILWRYAPKRWSKKTTPSSFRTPSEHKRMILDVPTINIDPPGCTDIDDCISIWTEKDTTKFAITIADVHAWVTHNPELLSLAPEIGQTFYKDGAQVNPMLPSQLADNLCSLLPGTRRLGLALIGSWNGKHITNVSFQKVVILNKRSYTYDSVKKATDFPIDVLEAIASYIAGRPIEDPHEWVEQLMIYYNCSAALKLNDLGGGIFRSHSAPDRINLAKYESWGADIAVLAHRAAVYTTTPDTHYGLDDRIYCHATSPIRRWSDVVNQGILKGEGATSYNLDTLNQASSHSKKYERDIFFLNTLLNHDANAVTGRVLSNKDSKARVWVYEWKRTVTVPSCEIEEGRAVLLHYFLNMDAPSWKKRMVFKCVSTDCPEQPVLEQSVDGHPEGAPAVPGPA